MQLSKPLLLLSDSNKPSISSKKKEGGNIIKFTDEEFDLYNRTNQELGIDQEHYEDLKTLPQTPKVPSEKELDRIIKDVNTKTTLVDPGKTPSLTNMLGPNDRLGRVTDEDMELMKARNEKDRKELIMLLAEKETINMDIKLGVKEGRSVYVQKRFYFNSIDKREEFDLGMKKARLAQIPQRYTRLTAKPQAKRSEEEEEFLELAHMLLEVASYQFSEFEAQLRLGMPPEDFARVDIIQYGLALQVLAWRTMSPSSSSQGP
jgi:hypothetical protein